MRILVLALKGFWDTGLTVTLDAFKLANDFSAALMGGSPHFDVSIVGVRRKVRSGQGFAFPVKRITPDLKPDWVIVPALSTARPEQLLPALERRDVKQAVEQLQRWYAEGARIAASCIGTFLLAETGLLDGGEATTTWWLSPLFRQRYPNVRVDETRMLVTSDRVVTAGAAMGHLDLALWLIRQASPELAALVSRYLLADLRSSQALFVIPNHLAQADPLIQRFERWAREHLKEGFSLQVAAEALATSTRTPATPVRSRAWQVAALVLSGSPCRARAISAAWQWPRRRRYRQRGRLRGRSNATHSLARTLGTRRTRASR